jgi:hypothetical protein
VRTIECAREGHEEACRDDEQAPCRRLAAGDSREIIDSCIPTSHLLHLLFHLPLATFPLP